MNITQRLSLMLAAAVCAFPLSGQTAASKPDLSGKWHLNLDKSWQAGGARLHYQSIVLEIDHREPAIRIVQTVDGGAKVIPIEVKTDGVPVKSNILGGEAISWAKWENHTLVSYLRRDTGGGRMLEIVRRLSVSADGKTMTAIREQKGAADIAEYWDKR
jgi:hypothetical protein